MRKACVQEQLPRPIEVPAPMLECLELKRAGVDATVE